MRKIYLKILIGIVVLLWIIYFIQVLNTSNNKNNNKDNKDKKEGFTSRIHSLYRPYIRTVNQGYESFVNNYGPNIIINKLRKWNIY